MARNTNVKTERLFNLLAILTYAGAPVTRSELTRALSYEGSEESMRTAFERDKDALREQGVPIEVVTTFTADGHEISGYRIDPDWFLADPGLDDRERWALGAALRAVDFDPGSSVDPGARLGSARVDDVHRLFHLPSAEVLGTLSAAAAAGDSVSYTYKGTRRRLDVWSLLARDGAWYLMGWDHGHGEKRTYRVDRIEGKVTVEGPATHGRPEGFSASDSLPEPMLLGTDDVVTAMVRVDADHAERARLDPAARHVDELADGSVELSIDVRHRDAFRSWLFGYLDHAVVVSPDDLRAEVVEHLRAMVGAR